MHEENKNYGVDSLPSSACKSNTVDRQATAGVTFKYFTLSDIKHGNVDGEDCHRSYTKRHTSTNSEVPEYFARRKLFTPDISVPKLLQKFHV
jgi:hypothetical protein